MVVDRKDIFQLPNIQIDSSIGKQIYEENFVGYALKDRLIKEMLSKDKKS